jgi:hypothetical protein
MPARGGPQLVLNLAGRGSRGGRCQACAPTLTRKTSGPVGWQEANNTRKTSLAKMTTRKSDHREKEWGMAGLSVGSGSRGSIAALALAVTVVFLGVLGASARATEADKIPAVVTLSGGKVDASDRGHRPSERLWLDREIESRDPLLLYETRVPLAFSAGYAYRDPSGGPQSVCASIGAITFGTGGSYFIHGGECAPLWPSGRTARPPLAAFRIEGLLRGHPRSENFGLLLTAPTARRLRLEFAEGHRLSAGIRSVNRVEARRAHLPAFGYAEYRFPRAACIRKVEALNAIGTVLGTADYPRCKESLSGTS